MLAIRWLILFLFCASVVTAQSIDPVKLSSEVKIYRDTYGVPHVFGKTDAAAVFGFAYAQAEDNFWRVEENFIQALGRGPEIHGQIALNEARLNHALEIPRLAPEEYARLDPKMRSLCDAFAAGFNFYLQRYPQVRPRLLTHIEPWYTLAFIRYNYFQNGFARDPALAGRFETAVGQPRTKSGHQLAENDELPWANTDSKSGIPNSETGSNGWVINPSRSKNGHAMLFINPHLPFFGSGQVYEGHIHSEEGWNFTGYTRFGFPFPYVGHNEDLGWVSTDNAADLVDVYAETFDDSRQPLAYRYGDGYRQAEERTEEIRVKTGKGIEVRRFRMVKTHHGPILAVAQGKHLAIRMAKFDGDGWLQEWYQMTKAKNLTEFKAALQPLNMLFGNVMYADRSGNTFYLYNGAVPRRNTQFDWTKPVDGSDPATEWHGYHSIEELPQLTNPKTGWMQNCNTTPFLLTDEGNPDPANYPKYMVQEGDNPRGRISRRLLAANAGWDFEAWTRAGFDTRVIAADDLLPQFLAELKAATARGISNTNFARVRRLRDAYDELLRWDRHARINSVAMTIFNAWRDQISRNDVPALVTADWRIARLSDVLEDLERRFGTWRVAWGDINRLQRLDESKDEKFSDLRASLAVAGVSGANGAVFTYYARAVPGQKRLYGQAGASYVSVVEFAPKVRALSIHVFGASGNPKSSHYSDQARLYARGRFKPTWFTLEEIKANLEAVYDPGKEK